MLGARLNKFLAFMIVASAIALASVGNASAQSGQSVEDFYRGKQVRFITGYSAGGLFDSATRIFARHLGKFIPGNPSIWVDNMTGAGGLIATNYLANAAPRDGTVMLNLDGALSDCKRLATRQRNSMPGNSTGFLPLVPISKCAG